MTAGIPLIRERPALIERRYSGWIRVFQHPARGQFVDRKVNRRMNDGPIIGIHHVQLAMPAGREDDARRFYSGVLGIPEVQKPADLARRGGAWFETGDLRVHLGVETDFRPAHKAHPGLLVRDLKLLSKQLTDAGYEVTKGEPLEGYEHVYVNDPFGNRLELLGKQPKLG
jgi:catechol 2,3-dioxygenase-like lactoylglutathione lyase family enzyme